MYAAPNCGFAGKRDAYHASKRYTCYTQRLQNLSVDCKSSCLFGHTAQPLVFFLYEKKENKQKSAAPHPQNPTNVMQVKYDAEVGALRTAVERLMHELAVGSGSGLHLLDSFRLETSESEFHLHYRLNMMQRLARCAQRWSASCTSWLSGRARGRLRGGRCCRGYPISFRSWAASKLLELSTCSSQ